MSNTTPADGSWLTMSFKFTNQPAGTGPAGTAPATSRTSEQPAATSIASHALPSLIAPISTSPGIFDLATNLPVAGGLVKNKLAGPVAELAKDALTSANHVAALATDAGLPTGGTIPALHADPITTPLSTLVEGVTTLPSNVSDAVSGVTSTVPSILPHDIPFVPGVVPHRSNRKAFNISFAVATAGLRLTWMIAMLVWKWWGTPLARSLTAFLHPSVIDVVGGVFKAAQSIAFSVMLSSSLPSGMLSPASLVNSWASATLPIGIGSAVSDITAAIQSGLPQGTPAAQDAKPHRSNKNTFSILLAVAAAVLRFICMVVVLVWKWWRGTGSPTDIARGVSEAAKMRYADLKEEFLASSALFSNSQPLPTPSPASTGMPFGMKAAATGLFSTRGDVGTPPSEAEGRPNTLVSERTVVGEALHAVGSLPATGFSMMSQTLRP